MIPTQTLETFPVFGDNATKVQPDNGGSKYSNGFQQSDVLPAEWLNWEWNKASSGVTKLNEGLSSVEGELNNVLSEAGISPSGSVTNQVYKAIKKTNGYISAASKTITGAPTIETGSSIKILFTADITGNNTTDALVISYNGTGYTVKVSKNGSMVDVLAHELTVGATPKYIQQNTLIDFVFDGTYLVIVGNPVVLSGADYKIYANGYNNIKNNTINTIDNNTVFDTGKILFAVKASGTTSSGVYVYYPPAAYAAMLQNNNIILVGTNTYAEDFLGQLTFQHVSDHINVYARYGSSIPADGTKIAFSLLIIQRN